MAVQVWNSGKGIAEGLGENAAETPVWALLMQRVRPKTCVSLLRTL